MLNSLQSLISSNETIDLNQWNLPILWSDLNLGYPTELESSDDLDEMIFLDSEDYDQNNGFAFGRYGLGNEALLSRPTEVRHSKNYVRGKNNSVNQFLSKKGSVSRANDVSLSLLNVKGVDHLKNNPDLQIITDADLLSDSPYTNSVSKIDEIHSLSSHRTRLHHMHRKMRRLLTFDDTPNPNINSAILEKSVVDHHYSNIDDNTRPLLWVNGSYSKRNLKGFSTPRSVSSIFSFSDSQLNRNLGRYADWKARRLLAHDNSSLAFTNSLHDTKQKFVHTKTRTILQNDDYARDLVIVDRHDPQKERWDPVIRFSSSVLRGF